MYFNRLFQDGNIRKTLGGLGLSLSLILGGCTPDVGEKPPEAKSFELSSTKCFNQATSDLKAFFTAQATDDQLASAWGCLETAFTQFEKYIENKDPAGYTSQEIVDFLETHFFEQSERETRKISPELQAELMKIKRIFIGGTDKHVTRDELKNSREFLATMSRITRMINPFMKVIALKWKPDLSYERPEDMETFEESNKVFQVFAKEVAEIIKSHEGEYKLDDAVKLAREMEKYFGEDWGWIEDLENGLPGAKKLKVTLAGGQEDLITNKEWSPVLILGARGYFQYLRYHYFIQGTPETGSGVRLVYVMRTLEDVFSIFQDLLSQKSEKQVSRKEVYEILKAFEQVFKDLHVSETLILEFMKIKVTLIGGSVDTWTVDDFAKARQKIPELRRIIEQFLPYFNIYIFDWDPNFESETQSRKIFSDASKRLYSVAYDLGNFMEGSYSYADFLTLLKEIDSLYPQEKDPNKAEAKLAETFKKYEALFVQANQSLFSRNDTVVTKETWPQLLPLVGRFYSLYQYFDYFLTDKDFKHSQTIEDVGVLVDNGLTLFEALLKLKPSHAFTHAELVQISMSLSEAGVLPQGFRKTTFESLWTAILQHVLFDPERRLAGQKNSLLSYDQLNILRKEFNNWKNTQLALNDMFTSRRVTSMTPDELMKALKERVNQSGNDAELKLGLTEVYAHLDSTVTKTLDAEDQLQISNKVEWVYKINALFQANLSRMVSRLLIRAFSGEKELTRVNECEARTAFFMLVDAFRDLRIFDPSDSFIDSRFLEANIFMTRGNGDKYLDIYELGDLVTVIFSGLKLNKKFENSIRTQCGVNKDKDGKEFVTFKCMSEHHYLAARKYLVPMPDFKAYLDKMAAQDKPANPQNEFEDIRSQPGFKTWNPVFRATLKATGWKPNKGYGTVKEESVYLGEALYYPFVVHYMELLYSRFDSQKNGILQTHEARKAFPTFKPLLKDLAKSQIASGLLKESDLLAVFTFILRYQEEPGLSNVITWLKWKTFPSQWDVWVGRTQLAQILGFIADKTAENSSSSDNANKCKATSGRQEPPVQPQVPVDEAPGDSSDQDGTDEPFPEFPEEPSPQVRSNGAAFVAPRGITLGFFYPRTESSL